MSEVEYSRFGAREVQQGQIPLVLQISRFDLKPLLAMQKSGTPLDSLWQS